MSRKANGQWKAMCSKGTLYTIGVSKRKAIAIANACVKAWKAKTGKE